MLRTIAVRNQILNSNFKKAVKSNLIRCLSTQLIRRKHGNKLNSISRSVLPQCTYQLRLYSSLPSHIKVNLPALSPTMESGTIVRWDKKEGDKLNEGDLLCEIETDKATMGFETPEEGYLAKIIIPAGTKGVPVGKLVCVIVQQQADIAAFKDFKDDSPAPAAAPAAAAPAPAAAPAAAPVVTAAPPAPAAPAAAAGGRVYASPLARRLAELRNLRLSGQGSGVFGSLKSGDLSGMSAGAGATPAAVTAAAGAAPSPAPGVSYVDVPLTGMREVIAKRLTIAKQSIPHYQLSVTVNAEKTLAMRQKVNKKYSAQGVKVSVNDFIVKAMASACKRVPKVNAHWMDTFIREFSNVDVSIAVATPTGLITPIVFNADSRGIIDLSKNIKELAVRAREGQLAPNEYQGGTITVSNLGMFDITMFNAIINPPQALILACGGIQELVIPDKDESQGFRLAKFITFTASADHRVIDGAVGAEWMKAFKENFEDPSNMIL